MVLDLGKELLARQAELGERAFDEEVAESELSRDGLQVGLIESRLLDVMPEIQRSRW